MKIILAFVYGFLIVMNIYTLANWYRIEEMRKQANKEFPNIPLKNYKFEKVVSSATLLWCMICLFIILVVV